MNYLAFTSKQTNVIYTLNTIGTVVNIIKTIIKIAAIFSQNPALAMSAMRNSPELNTIAFGGVATGIMKAQLAANAAGITSIRGPSVNVTAIGPSKGKKLAAVAVLLVTSVKNKIVMVTTKTAAITGMLYVASS